MSFTIPPGTPKAVKAAAFGRELVRACKARNVPLNELGRVTGVGHSSLDNYRRGLILPKVEVARCLAQSLDWPRLASMIVEARTFICARAGCGRTFRNDTGAPRRYCSESCCRIAGNVREAQRRARSAGQTGDRRTRNAVAARLRSGLAIVDERAKLLEAAIAAMCNACEPDGVCRLDDCPLRPFSPLPLAAHESGRPRTLTAIRSSGWTPARRERFVADLNTRWAQPGAREAHGEASRLRWASLTPEQRAERGQMISTHRRRQDPAKASQAARKAWVTRRARAAAL